MKWKEVVVETNNQGAEAVSVIMNELGSNGLVYSETNDRIRLTAYYHNNNIFPELIRRLKYRVERLRDYNLDTGDIIITVNDLDNEDWAINWQQYFKPLEIGNKMIISPSWETVEDSSKIVIKIDPGMAFGVGSHETTRLCLELLEDYISSGKTSKTMLDIGTGTGILAIAAALLGVDKITGIDIDPVAVKVAQKNIKINCVEDKIEIIKGDMTKDLTGKFSIVVANLLPDLISKLIPSVPLVMDFSTLFILSGIITEKRNIIINKLNSYDLKVIEERSLNDWIGLVAIRE